MSQVGECGSFDRIVWSKSPDLTSNANPIFKRDQCSDAFGADRFNSICSPSNTLCCVQQGEVFPSCQQELGMGWCCVGNGTDQDCYVDQPSVCNSVNSVACINLAPNTTSACCPRLTRCSTGYQASENNVRCEIGYDDLMQLAATASQINTSTTDTSSTSSSSTSTSTSTISSVSSPSASTGSAVQTPSNDTEPQQSGRYTISSGAIAGITVGAVGFIALAILAFYFLSRRKTKKDDADNVGHSTSDGNVYINAHGQLSSHMWQGAGYPSELASTEPPKELPHDRPLGELPG
ncbi:hypothetical protein F4805DRAFT_120466 [Annulohypoxylon moriforme]|nr:hypothetical protein F4805DRAFT_120466 [Annulohypoxylon moriforme]